MNSISKALRALATLGGIAAFFVTAYAGRWG